MKITFVLPHAGLAGGIKVVAIYAERLLKRGHQVTVVSLPPRPIPLKRKIKTFLKSLHWPNNAQEPSHLDHTPVDHRILEKYRPVAETDVPDADVIIATWWETAEWIESFTARKGKKAYFIQHHEIFDRNTDRVKKTYLLPYKKITISDWLYDLMTTHYGDNNVTVIKNSVDTYQFHCEARSRNHPPCVGILYSPVFWKGCDISFKAIEIAQKAFPNLKVVSFGATELDADISLPSNFHFFRSPDQENLKFIYSQCDVWVCGSIFEGFHLPPLEAMACRCPVVSTAVGGPVDIIKNGVNGYIVPVKDYQQLGEALIKVLSLTNDEWIQMSNHAFQTAHSYTWDDATGLFEQCLNDLIS